MNFLDVSNIFKYFRLFILSVKNTGRLLLSLHAFVFVAKYVFMAVDDYAYVIFCKHYYKTLFLCGKMWDVVSNSLIIAISFTSLCQQLPADENRCCID